MSKAPRIALLGCGFWGKNLARNLNDLGSLALVCDLSETGRRTAIEKVPGIVTSADLNDALHSERIDAVAIATPAETHFELATVALTACNDVFVEKPLALRVDEGTELQRVAEEHGRVLMVGHLLEYHPAVMRLRELIDTGELGDINYVYSNRLNFGKVRTEENALWSFAPHDIAVILRLLGEMPSEVTCVGGSYLTPGLADVTVSSLLFQSGRRAHVFVSWLNPFKEQKLVVMGKQRMAVFNDVEPEHKLSLFNQRVDLDGQHPVLQRDGQEPVDLPKEEPLRRECEHFVECIQTRQKPLTDAKSGVRVLRVLEACQESLQQGGCPISPDEH